MDKIICHDCGELFDESDMEECSFDEFGKSGIFVCKSCYEEFEHWDW